MSSTYDAEERAELAELQQYIREGAADLATRVLHGKELEWKPGAFGTATKVVGNYRRALQDELRRARPRTVFGSALPSPTGAPGRSFPISSTTPAATNDRALADVKTACMKHGLPGEILGALGGVPATAYDSSQASGSVVPGFSPGYNPDPPPGYGEAIDGLAALVMASGIAEEAATEVGKELALEVVGALPLIGACANVSHGVVATIQGGLKWWKSLSLYRKRNVLPEGAPRVALAAVRELIQRKGNEYLLTGVVDGTSGGVQIGAAFADFGAATGPCVDAAKTAIRLTQVIFRICRDLLEYRQANAYLRGRRDPGELYSGSWETGAPSAAAAAAAGSSVGAPAPDLSGPMNRVLPVSLDIIEDCPLLGCYVITEADDAVLLAMMTTTPLEPGWVEKVFELKDQLDGIRRAANNLQRDAPYRLKGELKASHFLDFRMLKIVQRKSHELRRKLKDPQKFAADQSKFG